MGAAVDVNSVRSSICLLPDKKILQHSSRQQRYTSKVNSTGAAPLRCCVRARVEGFQFSFIFQWCSGRNLSIYYDRWLYCYIASRTQDIHGHTPTWHAGPVKRMSPEQKIHCVRIRKPDFPRSNPSALTAVHRVRTASAHRSHCSNSPLHSLAEP